MQPADIPSIRAKVIIGFTIALVMISSVVYVSYRSHRQLVDVVSTQIQPDYKLLQIKQVLSDLSDAESSIRAYVITGDRQHLDPYYNLIATVDINMNRLIHMTQNNDAQQKRIYELRNLVLAKLDVLNELFKLTDEEHDRNALQKALNSIKNNTNGKTAETPAERNKILTYLKNLFQKKETNSDTNANNKSEALKKSDATKMIRAIMAEEKAASQQTAYKVLALTRKDQLIMSKIKALVTEMEKDELVIADNRASTAINTISKTINLINILLFLAMISSVLFVYMIFLDIRKNNRYNAALLLSKKNTEKLAQVKQEFLANMSHEIKTPLNTISGFSSLLKQTKLDDEQQTYTKVITNASEHLVRMLQDILDFSKIESGKLRLETIPFRLKELVEEACFSMKPLADQKELDFYCEVKKLPYSVLMGDPARLRQIILNLVSNAIKFTEKGQIKVITQGEVRADGLIELEIQVIDTGIGIAGEDQKKIFEEFNQADNSITRRFGGTGLGLTVCKKLVQMQNGLLELKSEPGIGTTFRVVIPYARANELAETLSRVEMKDYHALKGLTALIVDDDSYNLELLSIILYKWGVLVNKTNSGKEAISLFDKNRYDFILLDIQMPEMSGLELVKHFRKEETHGKPYTPVLAISAVSSGQDVEGCLAAGMNGFVFKPFKEKELYENILKLVHKGNTQESASFKQNKPTPPLPAAGNTKQYDLKELLQTADNDPQVVISMLSIFIKNIPAYLQEMETALNSNDSKAVAALAHRILPSCRHLCMEGAVKILTAIKENADQGMDASLIRPLLLEVTEMLQNATAMLQNEIKTLT